MILSVFRFDGFKTHRIGMDGLQNFLTIGIGVLILIGGGFNGADGVSFLDKSIH